MQEKARSLPPVVALLILVLLGSALVVGGLIVIGFVLRVLVEIADIGWSIIG